MCDLETISFNKINVCVSWNTIYHLNKLHENNINYIKTICNQNCNRWKKVKKIS